MRKQVEVKMEACSLSRALSALCSALIAPTFDLLHLRMRLAAQRQVQVSKSPGAHLPGLWSLTMLGSAGVLYGSAKCLA